MADQLRRVRISVPAAVVMIFVFVSSGAFGLEDMASSGAGMMVLMLVALPFVWALPMALVCSELGSAHSFLKANPAAVLFHLHRQNSTSPQGCKFQDKSLLHRPWCTI